MFEDFLNQFKQSMTLLKQPQYYGLFFEKFFKSPQFPLFSFLSIVYGIYAIRKMQLRSKRGGIIGFLERLFFSFVFIFAPREIIALFKGYSSIMLKSPKQLGWYVIIFTLFELAPNNILQKIIDFPLLNSFIYLIRGILQARLFCTTYSRIKPSAKVLPSIYEIFIILFISIFDELTMFIMSFLDHTFSRVSFIISAGSQILIYLGLIFMTSHNFLTKYIGYHDFRLMMIIILLPLTFVSVVGNQVAKSSK